MRIFILAVCALLCLTANSYAQNSARNSAQNSAETSATTQATAPEELQGKWNFPMCRFSELYFTISKHFTMRADRNAAFFERLASVKKDGDHYMFDDHKKIYALHITPGTQSSGDRLGFFYLMDDSDAARKKFEKDPLNPKNGQELDYARCPKDELPDWTPVLGAKLNSLALLDTVYEACGDRVIMGNEPCQRTIFNAFDEDHDGSLNYHELLTAYPRIAFIVAGNSCNFRIAFDPEKIDHSGVMFASETLAFLDLDKSGSVSFGEAQNLNAFAPGSFTYGFLQEVKTLFSLLPFLPAATEHYTCLSCGVGTPGSSGAAGGGCTACGGGK